MIGGLSLFSFWLAVTLVSCCIISAHCQIVFTSPPVDVVVVEGAAAHFDCGFTASVPVSISWLRDGAVLTPSSKYTILLNNSLVINPTETGDDVMYTCAVTNQLTGQVVEQDASLRFAVFLESFITTPASQIINEGETASFFCVHAGSLPPATVTWQLNGQLLVPSSKIFIVSSTLSHLDPPQVSSTLFVSPVQPADEGSYTCTATNDLITGATVVSPVATLSITPTPSPPIIIQQPESVIVPFLGQSTTLSCSASGAPPPTYSWAFNGILVTPSSSIIIESTATSSNLTVTNLQSEQLGNYSCSAMNSEGTVTSDSATLEIATIATDFVLQPSDTVGVIGSSAMIECVAPLSIPPATIDWLKAFNQIADSRYQILANGSLLISDIELSDQALYHCTTTNPISGVTRTSLPVQLTAIGVPVVTPSAVTVEGGGAAMFTCSAAGNPPPQITWYRGSNQITEMTSPRVTLTENTLTISDISLNDEDYYTCRAVFAVGETESRAILDVQSHPIFLDTSINITGVAGSPIILPCDIFPDPTISFTWSFSGQVVDLSDMNRYRQLSNGSLLIQSISVNNEGTFTCTALNDLGSAQGTVTLEVLVVPVVRVTPSVLNLTIGSTATFNCTASGDPPPALTWSYNDQQLSSGGRLLLSPGGESLRILNAQQSDEGAYVCVAENQVGSDTAQASLDVQAIPMAQAMPPSQELLVGTTAIFSCSVTGDPPPTVRWLNARSVDVLAAGDPRIQVLSNLSLVISDLQLSDGQQYVCEATNTVGVDVALVSLTVVAAPSVSLLPEITTVQGESLTLDCNVIGQPVPTVTWFRDGSEVVSGSRIQITNSGQLVFSSLTSTDSGTYRCQATNELGTASASTTVFVQVPPIILSNIGMVTFDEGDIVVLDCTSMGIPQPVVSWFHDSVLLPNPGLVHIQQGVNDSLIFNGVRKSDEGDYVCWAKNAAGNESATVSLRVNVPPTVSAVNSMVTAVVGSRASLMCTATGDPSPVLTWTRDGVDIPGTGMSGQYSLESDGAVLIVESVRVEDEGDFQCHASNVAGMAADTVTLVVIVPPTFSPPLTNSSAVEGSTVSLTCMASGDPTPQIVWSRGPDILATETVVILPAVSRGDTGFYRCTASNSAGTINQDVYLDVYYEPEILELTESMSVPLNGDVVLSCVADGNPPPDITWLLDGTIIPGAMASTYSISPVTAESGGVYSCMASNIVRTVSAGLTLTVLFPPSAPTLLTVTAMSSSTISVQWAAAQNDGGSPITGYTVEYRAQGTAGEFTAVSVDESTRSTLLSELAPFIVYDIRVRAVNAIGQSDPSATHTAQTHPDAPVAPGNLRITSSTPTSISLAWDIPDPLNGNFAAYELRYGDEAQPEINLQELLLFSNQFSISSLSVGMVYRVEVRAGTISLNGQILFGPFAAVRVLDGVIIEVVTEPPPPTTQPPTTPQTFTSPEPSPTTPTAPPTTNTEDTIPPSTAPPSTSIPFTTPSVTVTPTSFPTTPSLNPPTVSPSLVMALIPPGTEGQILVFWREPSSELDTFDGYQILLSPPPPPSVITPIIVEKTPISGTHIISGLEHATMYTVTVVTYNEDGIGPQTASDSATTPESTPSEPRQVQVSALNQQVVLISWSPPEASNGVILDYTVRLLSEPSGQLLDTAMVDLEFVNFDGLDLNTMYYSVAVAARTSAGLGPESESVFFGAEPSTSTPATDPVTQTPPGTESTSEIPGTEEIPASTPAATSALIPLMPTSSVTFTSTPLDLTTLSVTPTPPATTIPPMEVRDDTYYIVRIVPPVVFGLFLIVMGIVTLVLCVHLRTMRIKRAGAYMFDRTDGQDLKQLTLEGEQVVASDDVKTSSYHVKNALDANFSYSPPPKEQHKVEEDDIDEPDIGVDLREGMSSPMGRDALEESPSRPESEELSPADFPSNRDQTTLSQETSPRLVTFDPNIGLSSGGLKETRIGAVGTSRDLNQQQKDGLHADVSAQMY